MTDTTTTTTTRSTTPGKHIASRSRRRQVNDEIAVLLAKKLADGQTNPWYGQGLIVRHIAIGLFEPVSLCGRYVGDVNSSPMPTLIGLLCRRCSRVWEREVAISDALVDVENEKFISARVAELVAFAAATDTMAFAENWNRLIDTPALRKAVRPRLIAAGIDITAACGRTAPKFEFKAQSTQ